MMMTATQTTRMKLKRMKIRKTMRKTKLLMPMELVHHGNVHGKAPKAPRRGRGRTARYVVSDFEIYSLT